MYHNERAWHWSASFGSAADATPDPLWYGVSISFIFAIVRSQIMSPIVDDTWQKKKDTLSVESEGQFKRTTIPRKT
jgi:hypothetical protein